MDEKIQKYLVILLNVRNKVDKKHRVEMYKLYDSLSTCYNEYQKIKYSNNKYKNERLKVLESQMDSFIALIDNKLMMLILQFTK